MSGTLGLALRHLRFHWGRSLIMLACLTLVLVLPITVNLLVSQYQTGLLARGAATPLLLGARGSRVDLVLKSLYFESDYSDRIIESDANALREAGFGRVIPLHIRHRVLPHANAELERSLQLDDAPLVGTDLSYFELRGLSAAQGSLPLFLGDAVVGARVAERFGLAPGDHLVTRPERAYDPGRSFQLKIPVVGVLAPNGTTDDAAVFADVRTTWVVDGIGHGHDAVDQVWDPSLVSRDTGSNGVLVATPKLARLQEITPQNRADYHFHGDTAGFPLTSAILVPNSDKMRTIAKARYGSNETLFLLEPSAVIQEVMGLVFQVKRFYDTNLLLVTISTALFMALVILLSARLRQPELETLNKLGSPRRTAFWLLAWEIIVLLAISALIASALGLALNWLVSSQGISLLSAA